MKYIKNKLALYMCFLICIINAQESNNENKKTIYIAGLGQSNMVGADDPINSFDNSVNSSIEVWNGSKWVTANLSTLPFSAVSPGANNILFQFGKKYAEENNVNVRLIYSAKGGASINYWIENGVKSVGFLDFTNQLSASNTKRIDIILWHQGESDGNSNVYYKSFQTLLNQFRRLDQISTTTPIIAGEVADTPAGRINDKFYGNFQAFIEDRFFNVAEGKDLNVIDEGLVTNVHFNAKALTTLGRERYYDAFLEIPRRILKENDIKKNILVIDGAKGVALRNDSPETIHLNATNNNVVVVLQDPTLCRKRYLFKRLDNSTNTARVISVNGLVDGAKPFTANFKQYDVLELYSDGIEWRVKKAVTPLNGVILTSPNGSKFRISVDNKGVLTTKKL